MIEQKYIDVIESLGWSILGDPNDTGVEIRQASPAGEDFTFYADTADFPKGVIEYARCFDPDYNVELWIGSRGMGGCPRTIRELVDDADAIKKMLQELADALNDVKNGTYTPLKLGVDLDEDDNLLDSITFKDVVLHVHCSARAINDRTIREMVHSMVLQRLEDMNELLDRNLDKIAEEARKGRE
mgnify:FL=1